MNIGGGVLDLSWMAPPWFVLSSTNPGAVGAYQKFLRGERMVEKLQEILPRQMFVLKIQAHALGRIVASRSVSALRKDVTGYLYGGDITRKMKLLEKQKKGKKRRGAHAKMEIPQEVFMKMVQDSER